MQSAVKTAPFFQQFPKVHPLNRSSFRSAALRRIRGYYNGRKAEGPYALRFRRGGSLLPAESDERPGDQRPDTGEKEKDRGRVEKKEDLRLVEIEKEKTRAAEKVVGEPTPDQCGASVKGGGDPESRNEDRGGFPLFASGGQPADRRDQVRAGVNRQQEKTPVSQKKMRFAGRRGQS